MACFANIGGRLGYARDHCKEFKRFVGNINENFDRIRAVAWTFLKQTWGRFSFVVDVGRQSGLESCSNYSKDLDKIIRKDQRKGTGTHRSHSYMLCILRFNKEFARVS